MSDVRKVMRRVIVIAAIGGILATVLLRHLRDRQPIALQGAVIRRDTDTKKELPIADVEISASAGLADANGRSGPSGFFSFRLSRGIRLGQPVTLRFLHPEYRPLELREVAGNSIIVARMTPIAHETHAESTRPDVAVANVVARYSIKETTEVNIGSAVTTFQIVNQGNEPCLGHRPCSPDGKWKAAVGSSSLDAGEGNEFRNARVSCIAGPCPFTKITSDGFSEGGRHIHVSVLDWSDTTTFLLEAEVLRPTITDAARSSYPVIFGQVFNFTLPAAAEGVYIQAEMNAATIVYPLGPSLFLSWANCSARVNSDQTKVYRCELKPGFRFR